MAAAFPTSDHPSRAVLMEGSAQGKPGNELMAVFPTIAPPDGERDPWSNPITRPSHSRTRFAIYTRYTIEIHRGMHIRLSGRIYKRRELLCKSPDGHSLFVLQIE